jgi:hypothetical protein
MDLFQEGLRERIRQNGNTAQRRQHIPEKLDALPCRLGGHIGQACDVSTGPGKAPQDQLR